MNKATALKQLQDINTWIYDKENEPDCSAEAKESLYEIYMSINSALVKLRKLELEK